MARTSASIQAHHEHLTSDVAVTVSSDRVFGAVFAVAFAVIGLAPLLRGGPARWWALGAGVTVLLIALAAPRLLHPFNLVWAKLAIALHRIVGPVAAAVVFYFVFTPMGLLLRASGKDLLRLRRNPEADSYWIPRDSSGSSPDAMVRQF